MVKYLYPFIILLFILVPAQNKNNFDHICIKTHVETSMQSMPKAFKVADSLYKSSKTPLNKAKSLLLTASLYQQIGDNRKTLSYAEKAKSFIVKADEHNWNFRITGFLATQYRLMGLYDKSEQYVIQAEEISKKIKNEKNATQAKILINQEIAYHEIYKGRYQKAIEHINTSLSYLQKIESDNIEYTDLIKANSYELLGECYLDLSNYSESEKFFIKAKDLLKSPSFLLGFVSNGLGIIEMKKKNWTKAKEYLEQAQKIAIKLKYLELEKQVDLSLSTYYDNIGKPETASQYYKKYIKLADYLNEQIQDSVNESYQKLDSSSEKFNYSSNVKSIIIFLLIIVSAAIFTIYRIKYKRQYKKFKVITDSSKNQIIPDNKSIKSLADVDQPDIDLKKKNESPMSPETEKKLLNLLDSFEKSDQFNDKNMSLTTLAAKLNTNIRYLSYVINTHKKDEFKTYINRLRINYIVNKLTTDEKYQQYKISVLAEECGFSTHSKFAAVFKTFTGISPSLFIKFINKNNTEQ